jgi:DNA-binding transcriptional LysR family regulator
MRGVRPTEYGLALVARARTIRAQTQQALEDVAQMRGRREGHVTIALSHLPTIACLPRVMREFRERWPDVLVRVEPPAFPHRMVGLREGAPDFAVVPLPVEPLGPEFAARPIYTTTVVAVVRTGHRLAKARKLGELVGAEWVLPNLHSMSARAFHSAFERAGLPAPRCRVTCEALTGLESLVGTSELAGVLPLEVHEARAGANGLARIPLDVKIEGPSLAIIRWADAKPTPAAAELAELFARAAHALARSRKRRG